MDATNGSIEGQQERTKHASGDVRTSTDSEQTLADTDQTLADTDQTLADTDQTLADSDQTLSERDQAGSDADQAGADSDQDAADRDQAASDRDLEHGADPHEHEISRGIRRRSARQRRTTAATRLATADQRDASAHARDVAAMVRDQAATARDLAMARLDEEFEHASGSRATTDADVVLRAAEHRARAARHRDQAAEHRLLAAQDREAAREDRERAARDRLRAQADRESLARQLALAETDALTGVRTRLAGLADLEREIDRSRRGDGTLVVAYVDLVGLKALNDSRGHAAGDELIKRVVALIRAHVRSYDLIMRIGGDEFLCALSGASLTEVRRRFTAVAAAAAEGIDGGSIRFGLAELADDENSEDLIARADAALIAARG